MLDFRELSREAQESRGLVACLEVVTNSRFILDGSRILADGETRLCEHQNDKRWKEDSTWSCLFCLSELARKPRSWLSVVLCATRRQPLP